jgi:hypothetical protein
MRQRLRQLNPQVLQGRRLRQEAKVRVAGLAGGPDLRRGNLVCVRISWRQRKVFVMQGCNGGV